LSKYTTTTSKICDVSKVFQHGKTQIPSDVRKFLELVDGNKLVWYKDNDGKIFVEKVK